MTEPAPPNINTNFAAWTAQQWAMLVPEADSSAAKVAIRFTEVSTALRESHARTVRPWHNVGVSSVEDFRILGLLRHAGADGIKLSRIAEHLRFEPGTVSSRVTRLEKHGFIERHENPSDRRSKFVRLAAGREGEVDDIYRALVANHERFFSNLTIVEHQQLAELLGKI